MKKIIFLFLYIVNFQITFSQTKEVASQIIKPQHFFLNSNLNLGGESNIVIDVQLPENTIKWYYAFSASRNRETIKQTQNQINLLTQLTRIIDRTGTTAKAISLLAQPPGEDYCDVYLLSSHKDAVIFDKEVTLQGFTYNRQGSRKNLVSGIVEVTDFDRLRGRQYLGFYNKSAAYGIGVAVEIVAIVSEVATINGWTSEQRQLLFDALHTQFVSHGLDAFLNESESKEFTGCLVKGFTKEHSPESLNTFAEFEYGEILKPIAEKCLKDLGIDESKLEMKGEIPTNSLTSTSVSKKTFIGNWKDDNSFFMLQPDGGLFIKWDNNKIARGNWDYSSKKLLITIEKQTIIYDILNYSNDTFIFQDSSGKDKTIYSAKRQ